MFKFWRIAIVTLIGMGSLSCSETTQEETDEAIAVYPGKADDYLSPTSREYLLWGIGDFILEEEWADKELAEKEAHVETMLGYKFKAYAHFINEYITDKSSHDSNQDYGGFAGLIKSSSLEWVYEPLDDEGMTWTFIWEMEMGGPRDLMDRMPIEMDEIGQTYFLVKMPKLSNSAVGSSSYPKDFNPETHEGELDEIQVMVDAEDESFDAFPHYNAMFEDGLFDVFILVGGDYNEKRWDLIAAEQIFDWLKSAGYSHSATELTELTLESAPFRKTITANGKQVKVEVTLMWPDIVPDEDLDSVKERVIAAYETMDLVVYDGHAGQDPDYSGVVYHYNPRRAISANDLAELNLPEKYQIYLMNGCKTYNAYPDAIYQNGQKTTANLDIISTVNFSWLSMQPFTTSGFLNELLARAGSTHDPRTYVEILTQINKDNNYNVYYGVHGLDDNAHINPYADLSTLCESCTTDNDCPGQGNLCVRFEWGKACAAECTANDGCPAGYGCRDIAVGGFITGRQCLADGYVCQ